LKYRSEPTDLFGEGETLDPSLDRAEAILRQLGHEKEVQAVHDIRDWAYFCLKNLVRQGQQMDAAAEEARKKPTTNERALEFVKQLRFTAQLRSKQRPTDQHLADMYVSLIMFDGGGYWGFPKGRQSPSDAIQHLAERFNLAPNYVRNRLILARKSTGLHFPVPQDR
jgi:hypothetical protein